jgi:hypothetical protein
MVVDYDVLPGAAQKTAVAARADTGQFLFSPSLLRQRTAITGSTGGRNSYGGAVVPQWVRVTWREGPWSMDFEKGAWKGGVIVGDYRVEVASRIPREVLDHAAALRGRALRLVFWVKDDGVLLAWAVQENGTPRRYSLHGGDFVEPTVFNGRLIEPGWYLTPDGRKVMIDR